MMVRNLGREWVDGLHRPALHRADYHARRSAQWIGGACQVAGVTA
jgi:hypothetical protein